jgi:chromosome segregation ATPase
MVKLTAIPVVRSVDARDINNALNAVREGIRVLNAALETLTAQANTTTFNLSQNSIDTASIQGQINALQAEVASLQQQIDALQAEIENLSQALVIYDEEGRALLTESGLELMTEN